MSRLKELIEELCPDGVEYRTFGETGTFYGGLSGKTKKDFGEGSPFLTYMGVFSNYAVDFTCVDYVRLSVRERQNAVHFGDVLFTVSSETAEECGMTCVVNVEPQEETYLNSFCTGWRPNDLSDTDPDFMKYAMRSSGVRKQIIRTANGVTRFNISKALLVNVSFPVPPIEVQREIVQILDAMQEFDDELSREIEARALQNRFSIDALLGVNDCQPDEDWMTLNDLCVSIVDGDHQAPPQSDSGIPFLVISNFNTGRIVLGETKHVLPDYYKNLDDRRKPAMGDVLLSVTGSYGIAAVVESDEPFCFQRHVALLKTKANSLFVLALMRSSYAQKYFDNVATGSAQKTIPLTKLRSMPVPSISADKQDAIAESFRTMLELAKLQEDELANRRKQFEYYRDKLLDFPEKAVRGWTT